MLYSDLADIFGDVCVSFFEVRPWFSMEPFKVKREDIGKTVAFCPVCDYIKIFGSVAIPIKCPHCIGILQFINIVSEFFDDEE